VLFCIGSGFDVCVCIRWKERAWLAMARRGGPRKSFTKDMLIVRSVYII